MLSYDAMIGAMINHSRAWLVPPARIRGSIVVSISACHAEDPGSIPGRGERLQHRPGPVPPSHRESGWHAFKPAG